MNFVFLLETTTPEDEALEAVLEDVEEEVVEFCRRLSRENK